VGVAVKVTLVPEQIAPFGLAAMFTDGTSGVFTVIVIVLLFAVGVVTQVRLVVITTSIWSPLASAASV
jgi:hypothetical protein